MKGKVLIVLPPVPGRAPGRDFHALNPLLSLCAECGCSGEVLDMSREDFEMEQLEDNMRLDPPTAVIVAFDSEVEVLDGEVLGDVCDLINRTEYLGIRTILLGKTPAANPAIFLSQSAAVIVHSADPATLVDLLRSEEWRTEKLLNLPSLSIKFNGQIVRSGT